MQKASIVMPLKNGQIAHEKAIKAVLSQTIDEIELIILDTRTEKEKKNEKEQALFKFNPRIYYFDKQFKNNSEMMNFGIEVSKSPYLIFNPFGVVLNGDAVAKFVDSLQQNPKAAMIYSNYKEVNEEGKERLVELYPDERELSENWEYGHAKAYRIEYLDKVGRFDESFFHVEEYELRLRLDDHYQISLLKEPLYTYYASPVNDDNKALMAKLHTKDSGKLGSFSYLFENKEKSLELERACKNTLRRRGAFLYRDNEVITYPKGKRWPVKVSVIIPCFNRGGYLGKAIDSILRQSYQDFEIVIVDNGSSDNSIQVAEEYCKKDKRIKLIKNKINIISVSLNKGLRAAKGKYYAQLDSDDEYAPDCLKNMVEFLESHPKCCVAVSYYQLMDVNSILIPELGTIDHLEYDRNNIMRVGGAGALRVYHREIILNEFGGFDEKDFGSFGEDYDLNLRISEKYDIGRVHAVCYYYRRHADNTDVIRDPYMKLHNKALARIRALNRRIKLNQKLEKERQAAIKKMDKVTVKAKKSVNTKKSTKKK